MSETTSGAVLSAYPTCQLRSHRFEALAPGPRLIVLGAVHGNEVCGARGIERVVAEFDAGTLQLARGVVTLLPVTNPLAYLKVQRNGERNLNRNLRPSDNPQDYEDQIANRLCPMLAGHDVLLDLHSFQAQSQAFAMIGPPDNSGELEPFAHAAQEQALALRLGVGRVVEGWLSTYAVGVQQRLARTHPGDRAGLLSTDPSYGVGTTEYMRSQGGYAITIHEKHVFSVDPPTPWSWPGPLPALTTSSHDHMDPGEAFEISAGEVHGQHLRPLLRYDVNDPSKLVRRPRQILDRVARRQDLQFELKPGLKFASGNPLTPKTWCTRCSARCCWTKTPAFILTQFGFTKDNVKDKIKQTGPLS
jgi:hypothetical protein